MSANPADLLSQVASSVPAKSAVTRPWVDRVGITASVACAIHCIAAPFLLLLLPAAGSIWADPMVHWVLALLVLPLALWVIYRGYLRHGKRLTLGAAVLGAGFIVAGLIAPMVSTQPLFTTPAPGFVAASLAASPGQEHSGTHTTPATATCSKACCPSVAVEQSNAATPATATIGFPAGGVLTMLGSVLLVLAHATNLYACRCFSKLQNACAPGCGCPA